MKIVGINASLSGTKTEKAMNEIKFDEGVEYTHINLKELDMSFADGRDYREYNNDNKMLVESLIEADGIIIGSPIFQASIPGVLKNLFDLIPINALNDKTIGIIITAGSPRHYLVAEHQLLPILHYLKMDVISKYVFIEPLDFEEEGLRDDIGLRIESLTRHIVERIELKQEQNKKLYDFL